MQDGYYYYKERIVCIDEDMAFEIAQGPYIEEELDVTKLIKLEDLIKCAPTTTESN